MLSKGSKHRFRFSGKIFAFLFCTNHSSLVTGNAISF
jgi:hypothetical protein